MPRTIASEITAQIVGKEIRRTRKHVGLTQADLATRIATSPTYITNVEAGRVNLTLGQLSRIAAAMGAQLQVALPVVEVERGEVVGATLD